MQNVSDDWRRIMADPEHYADVAILIPRFAPIGVRNIISLSTSLSLLDNGPAVGRCPAREIDAEILIDGMPDIPAASQLTVSVTVRTDDEYAPPINKGVFYIDTREENCTSQNLRTLRIHGFDGMLKAERPYPVSSAKWPSTDDKVLQEILTALGWTATPYLLSSINRRYKIEYPAQYSCRETLAGIAALYGGFMILSEDGRLDFVRLRQTEPPVFDAGRSMNDLQAGEALPPVSKITLSNDVAGGETVAEFTAGTGAGWNLAADAPWISQAAADGLLATTRGHQYQPFEASAVYADPALQVGDRVTLDGRVYTIYNERLTFGPLYRADFSAPIEERQNHEYPYKAPSDRRVERRVGNVAASVEIQADRITTEVTERTTANQKLQSQITQNAQSITAKVSATGGTASSFAYSLTATGFTLTAKNKQVLKATKDGVEIDGKVTAASGLIGGWTLSRGKLSGGGVDDLKTAVMQVPSAATSWVFAAGGSSHESYSDCPFRVNKAGEMWATNCHLSGTLDAVDGKFSGTVSANKILYSGANGYFSGSGLAGNSVTTLETSTGINTSLGFADFSDDVFDNRQHAQNIGCQTITIHGHYLGIDNQVLQLYNVVIGGQKYQILAKKAV